MDKCVNKLIAAGTWIALMSTCEYWINHGSQAMHGYMVVHK